MSTDLVDPAPKETPEDALQVMDSLGISDGAPDEAKDSGHSDAKEAKEDGLPAYAKERLGRQEKRHRREMNEMRQQMQQMQQMQMQASPNQNPQNPMDAQGMPQMGMQSQQPDGFSPGQNQSAAPQGVDDQIQRAVSYALQHKDMQERQARDAEKMAHVQEQYQALQDLLDKGSDKYEDFDEVVRSNKAPFTTAMRDAALLLPHNNADEVLYKLGKNKDELKRVSQLHPVDQAREMMKLSVALKDGSGKPQTESRPIGQIKNQPVSSSQVSDKTSVRELRERMKAGWK